MGIIGRAACLRGTQLTRTFPRAGFIIRDAPNHVTHLPSAALVAMQHYRAKSVTRRKVKDLEQGRLSHPLPPVEEPKDVPQYPALLRGIKENMNKFDKCVVLTRVGNFYELYFEHAEEYGPLLGLKIARKSTSLGPVAMAGFPIWQMDRYLKMLVQDLNRYVAISEEFAVDKPVGRKSSGPDYERKVSRVVTPGTLVDETFLDPYQNNFLLALEMDHPIHHDRAMENPLDNIAESKVGLAWVDLSTGDFFTQSTTHSSLSAVLMRISPREILLTQHTPSVVKDEIQTILGHSHELITAHETSSPFENMSAWSSMLETPIPKLFEAQFPMIEQLAGHRLLDYVQCRMQNLQLQLRLPRRQNEGDILIIDRGSLRGLEILETAKDGLGRGSLYHSVRRTVTKGGSRLLRDRLTAPSTSLPDINDRLALVTRFHQTEQLCENVVNCLGRTYDVQRLVQKFAVNKGDADDMLCLARAIQETSNIHHLLELQVDTSGGSQESDPLTSVLESFNLEGPLKLSQRITDDIDEEGLLARHRLEEDEAAEVAEMVEEVVSKVAPDEPSPLPQKVRSKIRTSKAKAHFEENEDPWIMRRNASEDLDRFHRDLEALKNEREELQETLKGDFGTSKLDLKWAPGLGHYCHITTNKSLNDEAMSKLGGRLISSSRSTRSLHVPIWSHLGERLAITRKNILDEESRLFRYLRQEIIRNLVFLRRNAAIIDELDVATSFAVLAREQGWTRPIVNNSLTHKIVAGRHPTVKLGLEEQGRTFVSNDLFLGERERVWIVTGPNMAGKSTFLRQNALITILAQVGSYVPAEHAELGVVDQIFSRIGAADDLFRNQSTFMVEMLETAAILKHATPRSFVIMDEVGRGTTPEDGTAVSFASLHHLYHTNRSRTLFATHFHALHDMTKDWPDVGRYCTDVAEDSSGSFTFIHKLKVGINRHSHALKVAKMAGLPESALTMAKLVSQQLTEGRQQSIERSLDNIQ